ncbi:MAG TPA: hypothetical protein VJ476_10595 [Rhizomicrobium sp.]|nr:hypothetical protein [Rhizomicrobium sp.]
MQRRTGTIACRARGSAAQKAGTNGEVDMAIKGYPQLEAFLSQKKDERTGFTECYAVPEKIMGTATGKGSGS